MEQTQTRTETDARQLIRTGIALLIEDEHEREEVDVRGLVEAELDSAFAVSVQVYTLPKAALEGLL